MKLISAFTFSAKTDTERLKATCSVTLAAMSPDKRAFWTSNKPFYLNLHSFIDRQDKDTHFFCPTSYFISYLRIASVADYQDSSVFVGQDTPALHFDFFSFVSKPCLLL